MGVIREVLAGVDASKGLHTAYSVRLKILVPSSQPGDAQIWLNGEDISSRVQALTLSMDVEGFTRATITFIVDEVTTGDIEARLR